MATQMQIRGGTTAENLLFTGAQRELTVNTDTHSVNVHDGITAGGFPLATLPQLRDGTFYYNEDVGSAANAYILIPKANTNAPSGYIDGVQYGFVSAHPNTGPSTASFQGLGPKDLKYPGGIDPLAGEISGRIYLIYDAANGWLEIQRKATTPPTDIISIGASVASGALTATMLPRIIGFRSSTPGSGAVTNTSVTSILSVVVPSGATLGTTSAVKARLALIAINSVAGVELAIANLRSGLNLDESSLITTVAISGASNLANVFYSTVARTNVPYRVVGYMDLTQATAGNWATSPTKVQGAGGNSLASVSGVGNAQTYQIVTGSRAFNTTYTNTTGRPITVLVTVAHNGSSTSTAGVVVDGVNIGRTVDDLGRTHFLTFLVQPELTYSVTMTGAGALVFWTELS